MKIVIVVIVYGLVQVLASLVGEVLGNWLYHRNHRRKPGDHAPVVAVLLAVVAASPWQARAEHPHIANDVLDLSEVFPPGTVLSNAPVVPGGKLLERVTLVDGNENQLQATKWEREETTSSTRFQKPPDWSVGYVDSFGAWRALNPGTNGVPFVPQKKWVRTTRQLLHGFRWKWQAQSGDVRVAPMVLEDTEVEWQLQSKASGGEADVRVSWWQPVATNDVKGRTFCDVGQDGHWIAPVDWSKMSATNGLSGLAWVTNVLIVGETIFTNTIEEPPRRQSNSEWWSEWNSRRGTNSARRK